MFLKDYERRITDMEDAREKALQELTEHYQAKLQEKEVQLDQASDEQRQQLRESEELQRQTEEDADREILDLKNRYERQLRQRWEENTKLRGEVGILSKKVSSLIINTTLSVVIYSVILVCNIQCHAVNCM